MVLDAPGFSYKICAYKILCAKIFIYDFFACVIFIVWKYVFCDSHSGEHFLFRDIWLLLLYDLVSLLWSLFSSIFEVKFCKTFKNVH